MNPLNENESPAGVQGAEGSVGVRPGTPATSVRGVVIPAHGLRPLVSVIIPAYDAARSIARTLDSLLAQTYGNFEVIVVDDGSTDPTPGIVEEYIRRDPRIRLLRQMRGGASRARNRAIADARGVFVAPLDADDIWVESKLAEEVRVLTESGPEVGLVYSWSMIIDEEERPVAEIAHTKNGDVLAELASTNFVGNGSAPMMRIDLVRKLGGYAPELNDRCEDWDLYLRIAEGHEFRCVPRLCVGYRQGLGGLSADYAKMEYGFRVLRRRLRERRPDIPIGLLRSTTSLFYFYLAQKSAIQGHYFQSLKLLIGCLAADPARLISRQYWAALGKWVLRVTALPVTLFLWDDQRRWGQLRRSMARSLAGESSPEAWHHEEAPGVRVAPNRYDALMNRRLEHWKREFRMRRAAVPESAATRTARAAVS